MLHDDVQHLQILNFVFRHDAHQFDGDLDRLAVVILHDQNDWRVQFTRQKQTGPVEEISAKRQRPTLFQSQNQCFAVLHLRHEVNTIVIHFPIELWEQFEVICVQIDRHSNFALFFRQSLGFCFDNFQMLQPITCHSTGTTTIRVTRCCASLMTKYSQN